MKSFRSKPVGWRGHTVEHSLARQGVKMRYAADKQILVDPVFYAQKREEKVPFFSVLDMARNGETYQGMMRKHPDADPEMVRERGIKAIETVEGDNTLSQLDAHGVDASVSLAQSNAEKKRRMVETLEDRQKASFLHPEKVSALKERLQKE